MPSRFPTIYSPSRDIRSFDPLLDLHREVDRLFDDVLSAPAGFGTGGIAGAMSMPRIDVHEGERELCVSADVPGVKPSEVDVRVDGDMLTISGEKKFETDRKQEDYHVMERSYGRFRRTVQLPFAPDPNQVSAECDHGVLTIRMPRQAHQERSKRIEVRSGASLAGEHPSASQQNEKTVSVRDDKSSKQTAAKH